MTDTTDVPTVNNGRFTVGNPGRKPGSRNKAAQLLDAINASDPEALQDIINVTVAEPRKGKPWAVQVLMDRLFPIPRDRLVEFPLTDISKLEDAKQATADIMNAVAAGLLTIPEGSALCSMIADYASPMIELVQEEARQRAKRERAELNG